MACGTLKMDTSCLPHIHPTNILFKINDQTFKFGKAPCFGFGRCSTFGNRLSAAVTQSGRYQHDLALQLLCSSSFSVARPRQWRISRSRLPRSKSSQCTAITPGETKFCTGRCAAEGSDSVQVEEDGRQKVVISGGYESREDWESPWDTHHEHLLDRDRKNRESEGGSREVTNGVAREGAPDKQFVQEDSPSSTEGANGHISAATITRPPTRNLEKELDLAIRAVQLACLLSQRVQEKIIEQKETADQKKDHSFVTVADWGVQAVITWVLSQGLEGELIPMIAEEDTGGLKGRDKIDLLQRVVDSVNQCLQEASLVGIRPPAGRLDTVDVLKAIGRGGASGGKKGRFWVLDPVDGTLGFIRGDQYAIALALMEDGEVVLAVLGCPNFPLRKQWLRYHHRYYRLVSKLYPSSPAEWHKGVVLTTTKGSGTVMMQPLVVDPNGVTRIHRQLPRPVHVSTVADPAMATFCEPFEKANSSHSYTAGLAVTLGLRNHPLRVYSLAKYAAIARGDAEIFMKFAKSGYKEKIWDHAAGVLIVQEAGGIVTDAGGRALEFSGGRLLINLDRGIIACSAKVIHRKLLQAVDDSWKDSTL